MSNIEIYVCLYRHNLIRRSGAPKKVGCSWSMRLKYAKDCPPRCYPHTNAEIEYDSKQSSAILSVSILGCYKASLTENVFHDT